MKSIRHLIVLTSLFVSLATQANIVLSYFNASYVSGNVKFEWETQSELNSMLFQMQRTPDDGANWITVCSISASGNSAIPIAYETFDMNPPLGTNVYRLRQLDASGVPWTSDAVSVLVLPGPVSELSVFPNPVSGNVVSLTNDDLIVGNVSILNALGQEVISEMPLEGSEFEMSIGSLKQGTYYIQIQTVEKRILKKFLKE